MPNKTSRFCDFFLMKEWVQFPSYASDATKSTLFIPVDWDIFTKRGRDSNWENYSLWFCVFTFIIMIFFR